MWGPFSMSMLFKCCCWSSCSILWGSMVESELVSNGTCVAVHNMVKGQWICQSRTPCLLKPSKLRKCYNVYLLNLALHQIINTYVKVKWRNNHRAIIYEPPCRQSDSQFPTPNSWLHVKVSLEWTINLEPLVLQMWLPVHKNFCPKNLTQV